MNKDIKESHEISICKSFLSFYDRSVQIGLLKLGNPHKKEPDCIYGDDLGIELVGVFDNELQAEKIYSVPRNEVVVKTPVIYLLTLANPEQEITKKLNKLNSGNYDGFSGKIVLLCNLLSPLIESSEVINYINSHTTFRSDRQFDRYFSEIWLAWQPRNNSGKEFAKLE